MPTYSVQINVNVPGVGDKTFTKTGVVAATISDAMELAKADVKVEVLAIQKTA